jgi:hypothetical protein
MSDDLPWTAEDIIQLVRLRQQGLARKIIAERTNRSENAIAGKLWRMKLTDAAKNPVATPRVAANPRPRRVAYVPGSGLACVDAGSDAGAEPAPDRGEPPAAPPTIDDIAALLEKIPAPVAAPAEPPPILRARAVARDDEAGCAWPMQSTTSVANRDRWKFCGSDRHRTDAGRLWPYCERHGRLAYGLKPITTREYVT